MKLSTVAQGIGLMVLVLGMTAAAKLPSRVQTVRGWVHGCNGDRHKSMLHLPIIAFGLLPIKVIAQASLL